MLYHDFGIRGYQYTRNNYEGGQVIFSIHQEPHTCGGVPPGVAGVLDSMIRSGLMKGKNNKIKTMKRQAYGFRVREFFKLKILTIHESRYGLAR